ncbi:DUF2062 domain-containing protein [Jiella avicenniae]|uniref:DUF2062 domain-containing protein n=1 Tax=Jiella avicenniae TaxID=2907202 RepID=A0A9X1P5C7_9HYPH|nr:DUF2062 domain-containing protein [Jiella avicenniae]MCE7030721.1 DUF2062 domain-containing protein [Jiella avicenniae]
MLFRRRVPEGRWARFRTFLWPRRSFRRSYRYFVKRVIRLDAAPHAVAAGFAAGVIASFTPFIGFHFLLAFAIAYLVAGNMAAAALGTAVGNPATFPFIWASTYEIGRFVTAGAPANAPHPDTLESSLSPSNLLAIWDPVVKPMLIGSIPLGLVAGALSYVLVRSAVTSFQAHRRRQIAAGRKPVDQAGKVLVERLAAQRRQQPRGVGGRTASGPDKV